ncbi:MAG: phospholipase D-like domain-containing protein [Algoriphagus sp.]|uniref:phospholipase D family protein n=1 Tax=Algoriphagus sp. TaxID=1872435 RepID=UPI00271F99DC|nr:phospholipase D-like domain-containing protein [Algoriphagus sp.]MDO8967405.1 phospholipase D-like domain-containing protein [Algoriphagus sp.]MDP2043330.1 phospholipase D-like domain-containing protein [Algoriphagus sp.]MDP3198340.1 phospholipase D-like domain-containing protein [Algoriphagus sp.]MDP3471601.1 phospholipase D-like domain-containing protein [Algoriphagus sp.]
MAKFLNTTGISYHLEELIKNTKDRLILISPYLQFHKRVKDHLENLNIQKRDIRIIYRENKLQVEESNWLEKQIGIRTSLCNSLHAKCYINENEAIVTSMNLYSFSQQNNDEMGIYVTKDQDRELFNDISEEVQRLLTISEEIRVSVKKVDKEIEKETEKTISNLEKPKDLSKSKLLTTKELSELTGISSRKVNSWFTDKKLMYKKDEDWITTKQGKEVGGIEKEGQYGKFVVWPEDMAKHIKE